MENFFKQSSYYKTSIANWQLEKSNERKENKKNWLVFFFQEPSKFEFRRKNRWP